MIDFSGRQQHDSHCILSFAGMNWRIVSHRKPLVYLRNDDYIEICVDMSNVRWDDYIDLAVSWMKPGNVRRM